MKLVADDVQTLVIPDCGRWLAELAPEKLLAALTAFLSPYRDHAANEHATAGGALKADAVVIPPSTEGDS